MSTRLDHVVLGVPDLSAGCAELAAAGLRFRPGGRHPGGTRNALLVAPGHWAYAELISAPEADTSSADTPVAELISAPEADTSSADTPVAERIRHGGLVAWALSVANIDAQVHRLSAQGFECQPVEAGARQTTDGRLVQWRSAVIGPGFGQGELPFLIEWAADGHRTGLAPDGQAAYLTEIEVAAHDLDRIRRLLRVLGLTAAVADGGLECSDGAVLMRFVEGQPRLSAVCLVRPDGRRVYVTDRERPRQLDARVDAAEEVG